MTNPAPTPELHHVLAVRDGKVELVHPYLSWHDAQNKWQLLDDERLAAKPRPAMSQLYYMVRSANDPKYAHLAPRLYKDADKATRALARYLHPSGVTYYPRAWLAKQLGWANPYGKGWHTVKARAVSQGYVARTLDGRAYVTSLAASLKAFDGSWGAWGS